MKEMTVRRLWRSCKCSGDNFGKYKNTKISEYKIQKYKRFALKHLLIIILPLSSLSEGRWGLNLKTFHKEWPTSAIITGGAFFLQRYQV